MGRVAHCGWKGAAGPEERREKKKEGKKRKEKGQTQKEFSNYFLAHSSDFGNSKFSFKIKYKIRHECNHSFVALNSF